jgi:hypothetical protein
MPQKAKVEQPKLALVASEPTEAEHLKHGLDQAIMVEDASRIAAERLSRAFRRIVKARLSAPVLAEVLDLLDDGEHPYGPVRNITPSAAFIERCWRDVVRRVSAEACHVDSPLNFIG